VIETNVHKPVHLCFENMYISLNTRLASLTIALVVVVVWAVVAVRRLFLFWF
jgi:hypothetical protein